MSRQEPEGGRPPFAQRVARGSAWMLGLRFGFRVSGLAQTVILARLLIPRDFGVIGMAVLVMNTLEAVSQTGIESALIYRDRLGRLHLDTAWTILVVRAVVLAGVAAALAPAAASFFGATDLEPYIFAIAGAYLIGGVTNIGVVYFRKDLEFGRQFVYEASGTTANILVSVVTAVVWRNPWSLVAGIAAGNVVRLAASFGLHPYRPRLRWDREAASWLYRYGRWLFGTNILTYLANKGDDLFIGRLLGAGPLGLYQMAFRLGEKPREDITSVISQVALPAYALVRKDRTRLQRGYRLGLEATASLAFPLVAALVALATEVTDVFLGAEWLPMVPALRILAVAGALRAVLALGGNLSQGVGQPAMDFQLNLARLVVMAVAIYPLSVRWGLEGVAAAVLLGLTAAIPVWLVISTRFAGLQARDYVEALAPPIVGSVLSLIAIVSLKVRVDVGSVAGLLGAVSAGAAVYLAWAWVTWRAWRVGPFHAAGVIYRALTDDRR